MGRRLNAEYQARELAKVMRTQAPVTAELPMEVAKTGPSIARHKSNQGYVTPVEFIRACEARSGLRCAWDLAATAANARAYRFYDLEMNSLAQPWHQIAAPGGFLWLNPPYDYIEPWAEKCAKESQIEGCALIVMLTPASVGSNWFRDHVHGRAMVYGLNGRIVFDGQLEPTDWAAKNPGQSWKPSGYPKDLMLSVFGRGYSPGFDVWTWPEEVKR